MQIYILLIDGSCFETEAKSPFEGLTKVWMDYFSDFELDDFIQDVNIVEWKDQKNRYLKNYKNKKNPIESFDINSEFKLKEHLKVKSIKKPTKELAEEFEAL